MDYYRTLSPSPIFLVGLPGVGKTVVGRRLARRLGREFLDTDEEITTLYHTSISKMFETCGVEKFRKRERATLLSLLCKSNVVISTGGGLPIHEDNMDLMLVKGTVVYLTCPLRTLSERLYCVKESRPLVAHLDLEGIFSYLERTHSERDPYYSRAHFSIDTSYMKSTEDEEKVVGEICNLLLSH